MTASPRKRPTTTKALQREIAGEIKDMPVESLLALREFAAFLRYRREARQSTLPREAGIHPTVEMSAESLSRLMDILPPIGGDALADTEALYDQD